MSYLDSDGLNWVYLGIGSSPLLVNLGGHKKVVPLPESGGVPASGCGQAGGYLWSCLLASNGDTDEVQVLRCGLEGAQTTWEKFAVVETDHGIPSLVLPLGEDQAYLAVSLSMGFYDVDSRQASLVARFKREKETLVFDRCIDMPLEDRDTIGVFTSLKIRDFRKHLQQSHPAPGGPPAAVTEETRAQPESIEPGNAEFRFCSVQPTDLAPTVWLPSLSRNHLVLASDTVGVLWAFEMESGTCVSVVNLTGIEPARLPALKLARGVILGTAFAPDGSLLVAARDPSALDIAMKLGETNPLPTTPRDQTDLDAKFSDFTGFFNNIAWWRVDPSSGEKVRMESPLEFPSATRSYLAQRALRFLVDRQGKVLTNAFTPWSKVKEDFGITLREARGSRPKQARPATNQEAPSSR